MNQPLTAFQLQPGDRVTTLPPLVGPDTQRLIEQAERLLTERAQVLARQGQPPYDCALYQGLLRDLLRLKTCHVRPRLLVERAGGTPP